ncbi:MAG: hypothetical protein Q4E09_06210 [Eubacteriales bacterium]|nr:hypothetical protein [Eubacteriales bacterium]
MKTSFSYTRNRLTQLIKSKQFIAFLIFAVANIMAVILPLRRMCSDVGYRIGFGYFPLLICGEHNTFLLIGAALLFADAPFIKPLTPYELIRSNRKSLFIGHCIYIILLSVLYILFIFVVSFLLLIPYVTAVEGWGKLISSVFLANLDWQYSLGFFKYKTVLFNNFTPLGLLWRTVLMNFLQYCLLGFAMQALALNFPKRKFVQGVFTLAYIFSPHVARAFGSMSWYKFLPASWLEMFLLDFRNSSGGKLITLNGAYFVLLAIIGLAVILSLGPVSKEDIYNYLGESR